MGYASLTVFTCPVKDCKFHNRRIEGSYSLLRDHIFRDHDYTEKTKTAFELGLIESPEDKRSSKWLAENLASRCIINA